MQSGGKARVVAIFGHGRLAVGLRPTRRPAWARDCESRSDFVCPEGAFLLPPIAPPIETGLIAPPGPSAGQARAAKRYAPLTRGRSMTLVYNVDSLHGPGFHPPVVPPQGGQKRKEFAASGVRPSGLPPPPAARTIGIMRIALAQINTTVGDVAGNAERIREAARLARGADADIVLLPELAVLGYPPRDLIFKEGLVERCEETVADLARELTSESDGWLVVIPSPRRNTNATGVGISNSIALCRAGRVEMWYDKRLLPTYDVFDETRYFDPGNTPGVIEHRGARLGLTICEDIWVDDTLTQRRRYAEDTIDELKREGIDLVLNASASPFRIGLPRHRCRLFTSAAKRAGVPLAWANLVGGNDDLIFDGHSGLVRPEQEGCVFEMEGFREGIQVLDTESSAAARRTNGIDAIDRVNEQARRDIDLRHLFEALTLGVRDYLRKCGFRDVWIALSGGIDSAVVAALAAAAIGPDAVRAVGLPSRYSSHGSVDDARDLAERLGIRFDLIPIEAAHSALLHLVQPIFDESSEPPGVAEENIQARLRGNIMMALTNKLRSLLLSTGNKSELAVGYCTLYGDMAGGLAAISDVPKTMVYELARWINAHHHVIGCACPPIPERTITKPPSAELKPDQADQDTLPPYEVLDRIIHRHVEQSQSARRIVEETGIDRETVERICRLIDRNEYKRRQMPTGLKVTGRAFGSGWRMPIAARFD